MSESSDRRSILLVTTLGSFLTPFMGSAVNVALPAIGREFALDAIALSWVATAYILAAAVSLVPLGKLADVRGRRLVFTWGIAAFTLGSVASAVAASGTALILSRILQGIGGAMVFGTSTAIITSAFPPGLRGRALGINVATVYLGLSLGPVLGGLLTRFLGWRWIFLACVPLGLLTLALVVLTVRGEWREETRGRFDLAGSAAYGLALLALMYGFSLLPRLPGGVLVLGGLLGLAGFFLHERRSRNPVLDTSLLSGNRVFLFSSLAAFVSYSATSAVGFLLSLYLQSLRGYAPQAAGMVLVVGPAMQTLVSPLAGRLSDRVEPRLVASLGMALTVAGLVSLVFLNAKTPLSAIIGALAVLGVGFGLFSSPNTNAIMSSVEKRCYGVASSMVATMTLVGQMMSMGIVMLVFGLFIGRTAIEAANPSAFLGGMKAAFIIFASLCFAGVFASLSRGQLRPGPAAPDRCTP